MLAPVPSPLVIGSSSKSNNSPDTTCCRFSLGPSNCCAVDGCRQQVGNLQVVLQMVLLLLLPLLRIDGAWGATKVGKTEDPLLGKL